MRVMRVLTYAELANCFHLPVRAACKKLHVGLTTLKHECRRFNIPRWPQRQLHSMDDILDALERGHIPSRSFHIDQLRDERRAMVTNGVFELSTAFKKLRQQYFKTVFALRKDPQYSLQMLLRRSLLLQAGVDEVA